MFYNIRKKLTILNIISSFAYCFSPTTCERAEHDTALANDIMRRLLRG